MPDMNGKNGNSKPLYSDPNVEAAMQILRKRQQWVDEIRYLGARHKDAIDRYFALKQMGDEAGAQAALDECCDLAEPIGDVARKILTLDRIARR
jgi:hypothetical protein